MELRFIKTANSRETARRYRECKEVRFVVLEEIKEDTARNVFALLGGASHPGMLESYHFELFPERAAPLGIETDKAILRADLGDSFVGGGMIDLLEGIRWKSKGCFEIFGREKPADEETAARLLEEVRTSFEQWLAEDTK
jgi:hypothetical protein